MATPNQKIELVSGGKKVDGVFQPKNAAVPAITPESLQPVQPMKYAAPATPMQTTSLLGGLEAQTDAFTQAQTQKREQSQNTTQTALAQYLESIKGAPTYAGLQSEEYAKKGGVDELQLQLNDLNDQMTREQHGLRRTIERIQKEGGGLASGAAAEIANLERTSLAKQADLAVLQQAAQGRYDSARDVAERAIQAKLEQAQNYNAALKFNYEQNKDMFDRDEQREFETLLGNRNRAIEQEAEKMRTIQNLALQALQDGAPPSIAAQMQKATSIDQAIALGGGYVGALDREAKRTSIYASNLSARKSLVDLAQSGDQSAIKELGFDPRSLNDNEAELLAYAQQYASTGKIPPGIKDAGVTFGEIAALARSLPTQDGTILDASTGVRPDISDSVIQDIGLFKDLSDKIATLAELNKQRWGGVVSGTLGAIVGDDTQQQYVDLRSEIVDIISRLRTGAALTAGEQRFYESKLPGRFDEPLGIGADSDRRIEDFQTAINALLQQKLKSQNLVMSGYSEITLGDQTVKVGDIIQNEAGQRARVNPDGTLTLLLN